MFIPFFVTGVLAFSIIKINNYIKLEKQINDFLTNIEIIPEFKDWALEILKDDFRVQIEQVLEQLNEREKAVINLRFGIMDDESDRTLEEIGKELNVTRERVRQIESSAIKKLKHPKVGRKLKNYIEE